MIEKEKFIELYELNESYVNGSNEIISNKLIDADYIDSIILSSTYKAFNNMWEAYFTPEGVDWLNWRLYEYQESWGPACAKDVNGNPIPVKTVDDVWNLVKEFRI